jgi:hypothetical protein
MTTKFISSATAIVILDVYLRSQLYSNDPLFLFVSSSLAVNLVMLMLAALTLYVSFIKRFKTWLGWAVCAGSAVILSLIGFGGAFLSDFFYNMPSVLLTLNYLFLMEAGVIFGICSLSYQHAAMPKKLRLPRPVTIFPKFAFSVPKFPHSPNLTGTASSNR